MTAVNRILDTSPELQRELERMGPDGVAYAKSISPDAVPLRAGYIDSFVWSVGRTPRGRRVLAIANTDFKALWIEHGTAPHSTHPAGGVVSTPAFHVLDKTLDHLRR